MKLRVLAALVALLSVPQHGVLGQRRLNHLAGSPSPYLRMHATDPVDWYPWSPEALDRARREQKPIFLSIGYSTCHWCHVMQAESFTDAGIAELLNQNFIPIKVDREERPDLDRVYMAYMTSVSGGGWPANVFLTPDLHPFYGVTYAPPDDRGGQPGLRTLLTGLSGVWVSDRAVLLKAGLESRDLIDSRAKGLNPTAAADRTALDGAYASMRRSYDAEFGGFGGAPKFPRPVALTFLLRYYARTGARPALDATLGTLRGMANGALRDHVGGGFHRYTTDAAWRVPHFEKMLYDQAQLAVAYTEAHQASRDPFFRQVAVETLDYVLRDLRDPAGGFYSAEDADSATPDGRHAEGAYYVWTADELRRVTGAGFPVLAGRFGIEDAGNVPAALDVQRELAGLNTLWVKGTEAEVAHRLGLTRPETRRRLTVALSALRTARLARPRPARDDKVLVAWNGLMISALARAAQVFGDARYLDAARASARFIQTRMDVAGAGGLRRRWHGGQVDIGALAEDYAYLIAGLLDLYEADFDVRWLTWAIDLQERQDRLFWDGAAGGYFSTTTAATDVVARFKDDYDGAEPSANSVSAMNLLRLWQVTDRTAWRGKADALFRAFAPQLTRAGSSVPHLASAFDFSLSKPKQIVIAGQPGAPDTRALLRLVHSRLLPVKVVLLVDGGAGQRQLAQWLPTLAPMKRIGGRATLYLCENYACRLPTADLTVAAALLDGKTPAAGAQAKPGGPGR